MLGRAPVLLGMTGLLGLGGGRPLAGSGTVTISLGRYRGLENNPEERETQHVAYRF
ncbi:hypothetical protein D3C85_1909520 [compost metagenome]